MVFNIAATAMRKKLSIGWIGTGVMGLPMCNHCLTYGKHNVVVCSRTPSKYESLVQAGAIPCDSPTVMVSSHQLDLIVTMTGYPKDVANVVFGPKGILEGLKHRPQDWPTPVFVDMSTGSPALAKRIAAALTAAGSCALDAPVTGGDIGAQEARLSIMVGGSRDVYLTFKKSFFECMAQPERGGHIVWAGEAGSGQQTKLTNQIMIATNLLGVCEGLLFGFRAGLSADALMEAVSRGAASSWSLLNLGPRIIRRDFDPGFFVHHFVKDLEIALDECRKQDLALPGLALAHQLFVALKAMGHSQKGTQALMLALESLNQVQQQAKPVAMEQASQTTRANP